MDDQLPYKVQAPSVSREDVDQEMALYALENPGKRPSRRVMEQKLALQEPASIYSGDISLIALPIPTGPQVNLRAIETLIEWSLEQAEEIQNLIFDFLDDPSDKSLEHTLTSLKAQGVALASLTEEDTELPSGSLIDALEAQIKKAGGKPITTSQLTSWVRTIHTAKRPEAAMRQALRRLVRNGRVIKNGDEYFWGGK